MEIMEKINEVIDKIKNDKNLGEEFKKEPVKTIENILGVDLPDEMVEKVVGAVKAELTGEKAKELLGGIGKLFGGK